jgi:beta-ureidopropionase / N-carbamoyl-L-amino-acid hydrolase
MPDSKPLKIDDERLLADFNELIEIGATKSGGITRLALSDEDLQARAWLASRFEQAGFEIYDDEAGNLSGILHSDEDDTQTLLIGSHLDSVPESGYYDGSIGVLGALECLRTIKENGIKLPVHLEAIDFTDEEGYWKSRFGSHALTGTLQGAYGNSRSIDESSFRAALFRAGIHPANIHRAKRDPSQLAGYLELHIEQSKRLDDADLDIGVVTCIVGRMIYLITFHGEASHSATTKAEDRHDALMGAASFITSAYQLVQANFPEGIINCGNLNVLPGNFNVVPNRVAVALEYRHPDKVKIAEMEKALLQLADEQAKQYRLKVMAQQLVHMPTATMAGRAILAIENACRELDVKDTRLVSYAGHDAQVMSNFTPSGIMFIPSVNGVSHHPNELTKWEHVIKGVNVLLHTILQLARDEESSRL